MVRRTALLCGCAFLGLAGGAKAQETQGGDTDTLRARLEALRARMDEIERRRTVVTETPPVSEQAVTGGSFPGSWKLPGSDTSLSFSGYTRADSFFTFNAPSTAIGDSFVLSNIPMKDSAANRQGGDYRMHSRQTRFRFESDTPTDWGKLQTRIEADFFGRKDDNDITESFRLRVRQAVARLGPVVAGQTESTFEDADTNPEMVDNFGAAGDSDLRQTMIRYIAEFSANFHIDAALENAFASVATPNAADPNANPNMIDRMPDIIMRVRYKGSWGAVNVSGVARYFNYDDGQGSSATALGGGGHLGAHFNTWGKDSFGFNVNLGPGLGRYIQTSNTSPETNVSCPGNPATPFAPGCAADLSVNMIYGGWAQYTHHWAETLRSNVIYGYMHADIPVAQLGAGADGLSRNIQNAAVNVIWNPVPSVAFGLEYMHGWRYLARAPAGTQGSGQAGRLQLGMSYSF